MEPAIASERFRGAFAFNDFVVVQIDTDVCENFVPSIMRTVDSVDVSSELIIEQVRDCLIAHINANAPGYYETRKSQIVFAVAVHSTECWLLPLYCEDAAERTQRGDCLALLNEKLRPLGLAIDPKHKGKGYNLLLRSLKWRRMSRDTVLAISQHNPGFAHFAAQIETVINAPATSTPKEP